MNTARSYLAGAGTQSAGLAFGEKNGIGATEEFNSATPATLTVGTD